MTIRSPEYLGLLGYRMVMANGEIEYRNAPFRDFVRYLPSWRLLIGRRDEAR